MKNQTIAIVAAALLLVGTVHAAIPSEEAITFLNSQGYLKTNETPDIPQWGKISNQERQYWVATILVGDAPTGFIAVEDAQPPSVPSNNAINQPLFRTAFVLRGVYQTKTSLGNQWFFIASNQSFFQNLSQSFQRESENDLSLIGSTDAATIAQIQSMKTKLSGMQSDSGSLADSLGKAILMDNQFFLQANTEKLSDFQNDYLKPFGELDALQIKIQDYDAQKTKLKALIAKSGASTDDKSFWVNLADPPNEMYSVKTKQSNAANNQQVLESVFSSAPIQSVTFSENLDNRLQMVQVKSALNNEDASLKDLAGKSVSLRDAAAQILSEQNAPQWNNQAEVQNLQTFWKKANEALESGNYAIALDNANKAKTSARKTYQGGLKDTTPPANPIEEWIPTIIGALVALMILLFLIQRRKKIMAIISPQQQGLEEQNYSFNFKN